MSVGLYVREGSRFVRVDDAPPVRPGPPISTSAPVDLMPDERPNFARLSAPRCPHGHFARWARRNCTRCSRQESRHVH